MNEYRFAAKISWSSIFQEPLLRLVSSRLLSSISPIGFA